MKTFIRNHPIWAASLAAMAITGAPIGAVAIVDITAGARAFDTAAPIDWGTMERTAHGFREQGILFDVSFDCTTGQLRVETPIGARVVMTADQPWVDKHETDQACESYGWQPQF